MSLAFSLAFAPDPAAARSAGETPGQLRAASGYAESQRLPLFPGSQDCPATAARPAAATAAAAAAASATGARCGVPCARRRRAGGMVTAGSLLDLHPSRLPAPSFPRQPRLGRAWGGGDRLRGGAPEWGLRRGKVRVGASGEERTPPSPGTGLRCAAGLSLPGRHRAPAGELEKGLASRGFRDQKGKKFIFPLGGRERFH